MKKIISIFLACVWMNSVHAQLNTYAKSSIVGRDPIVGQPSPDYVLHNIRYYPKKEAHIHDFKGKWLILDFWSLDCGSCIASFPHTNTLMKELGDKVQFMLVGREDQAKKIYTLYDKFRSREQLGMPCSFDPDLGLRFDMHNFPQVLVIDDKSIIRGWMDVINPDKLKDLLAGKIGYVKPESKREYNKNKPFLVNGNGGIDSNFLYRSVLSKFDETQHQHIADLVNSNIENGHFTLIGITLEGLYNYAYWGKYRPNGGSVYDVDYGNFSKSAVLAVEDSTSFKFDYTKVLNLFSYEVNIPRNICTKEKVMAFMRSDLKKYFGFDASIELRDHEYLALVATDNAKKLLLSKGTGETITTGDIRSGISAQNLDVRVLRDWLQGAFPSQVILDETGISGKIDISLDWVIKNQEDVLRVLRANGLDLVKKKKTMQVLVIKDPAL